MKHEYMVNKIVETYFGTSPFEGKVIKTKQGIQIGAFRDVADVVLQDDAGNYIAIMDYKGTWEVSEEIMLRLLGFLSATDTQFGVLAIGPDPESWRFWENHRNNHFTEISRDIFESRVVKWHPDIRDTLTLQDLRNTISTLEKAALQEKRKISKWRRTAIAFGITLILACGLLLLYVLRG